MYIYIYIYICLWLYMCIHEYIHINVCVFIYIYIYIHMWIRILTCIYTVHKDNSYTHVHASIYIKPICVCTHEYCSCSGEPQWCCMPCKQITCSFDPCETHFQNNIGALIIRVGFWGHYTVQNSIGNYLGPYIIWPPHTPCLHTVNLQPPILIPIIPS